MQLTNKFLGFDHDLTLTARQLNIAVVLSAATSIPM